MEASDFLLEYSWKPVIFYWNTHGNPVNILLEISFHVERINVPYFCIEGITPALAYTCRLHSHARFWLDFLRWVLGFKNRGIDKSIFLGLGGSKLGWAPIFFVLFLVNHRIYSAFAHPKLFQFLSFS